MDRSKGSLLAGATILMLSLIATVSKVDADAMVTGIVFCDQCKVGERSIFDYPLYGARVAVACMGANGAMAAYKEDTTNWMGGYAMRFPGSSDLSRCYARVIRGPSGCGSAAGPAQGLNLMFSMLGMQMYAVEPLLSQPQQPMPFCPRSSPPSPARAAIPPPSQSLPPPAPPVVPVPPPSPPRADSRPPRVPFLEASACSYDKWMMPEFKCYWKVVGPDTKVAVAFGPVAAGKYGTDMSLMEGLHGRGDTYRTLLREATTSLLNSYNSIRFPYPTVSVIYRMNWALLGSPQQALMQALRFKRANTGVSGQTTCKFIPCS
ncbi:uncharacterized protein A4U43_C04F8180 [Asparagus officinalis]|uniref:Uncharacterized protein n=1 Tax=Asparagus officinalis TaxID=4686 RepID=A0A5P1EZM7_ASPOF|nr:protodermal factor 1 [Asparagus officinalis]ONK71402.1 uncharacterized protein A4U43_C04F8180 [Asparagus officinalis]